MADTEQIEGNAGQATEDAGGVEAVNDGVVEADDLAGSAGERVTPRLDRSRSRLRLPADIVDTARLLAVHQSMPAVDGGAPSLPDDGTVDQLTAAQIMADGVLDPMAHQMLQVVNNASLIVTVELTYGDDQSQSTVWATPRHAVMSSTLEPDHVDYQPVSVASLPQTLAQLIVLQSPRFVGDVLLEIDTSLLDQVRALRDDPDDAAALLIEAGLNEHQAVLLVDLQGVDLRRWRIDSRWSTEEGPMEASMSGIDGADSGHWLVGAAEPSEGGDRVLYSPQGHGEVMSSFRQLLPKAWLGTPLDAPVV